MTLPEVSIIIPCLNEEKTILTLLESILKQTYPLDKIETVIADGMSEDGTRLIIQEFQTDHPQMKITLCDNPRRRISSGLNMAIRAAKGTILTRIDAHAIPAADYLEKSVAALQEGLGDNIGGVIDIRPSVNRWIPRSIAVATAHPAGVGDAKYRWAKTAGETDTVAYGTFFKSKVEEIGFYNESLKINEDYEFNWRLRRAGGKIRVDPQIRIVYFSRPTLGSLFQQYFSYGFWKVKMLRMYPSTLRWRQGLPPLFVLGILMLSLLSVLFTMARIMIILAIGVYLFVLACVSLKVSLEKKDGSYLIGVPLAIMTMHFSWGAGFWWSLLNPESEG
ncbi:MAG: glycosyltransferase family 2 protein [Chloroflexi bacterium]|nr:glycosyltransferase family 2 protein [Chloroflexota bacterium]